MQKLPSLNIGAGRTPKGALINCDLYGAPNIDIVFDACKPWPFPDSSIGSVESHHCFEHLSDVWTFIREAHRVLAQSALPNLTLRLPYGPGIGGLGDITHLRQYLPYSFCCFQPGYGSHTMNPQHDAWDAPFSVMGIYMRINPRLRWMTKPLIRRWGVPAVEFLWDGFIEMIVGMRALKTKAEVDAWQAVYSADMIPMAPCMYEHEYSGKPLAPGESPRLKFFGESAKVLQQLSDKEKGVMQ